MAYSQDRRQGYILLVGHTSDEGHQDIVSYGEQLGCAMVVAESPTQAIAIAQRNRPYLVMLSEKSIQQWSPQIAQQLRQSVQPFGVVIVAVMDSSELSWQNEPTETGLDGFFVEPISSAVLSALNETAIAKHKYAQYA